MKAVEQRGEENFFDKQPQNTGVKCLCRKDDSIVIWLGLEFVLGGNIIMSFQTPITIRDAIDNIDKKEYLLPAIQREFVWDDDQIERLFDSLMRGYPIGSFLFWQVSEDNKKAFQFYEFIRDFHQRDRRHNRLANVSGQGKPITAILDGQQRLTSLYIGLKGTYADKLPRYRWDSPWAFPERKLYLNLLSKSKNSDLVYDFQFCTKEEVCSDPNALDTKSEIVISRQPVPPVAPTTALQTRQA